MSIQHLALVALLLSATAQAQHDHGSEHGGHRHVHVHGIAKLEVAVEGADIHLHLETPLEGVLGFEHTPGNDKERAIVAQMRKTMTNGGALFAPTTAAQCKFTESTLEAPSLEPKPAGKPDAHEEHGDLDVVFRFTCVQPAKLTGVEVRLFEAFPKMRRIDAQVVSGKGQKAMRLSSKMRFLSW